ncbi:hypothetical protein D3C74_278540 [compost metagenome]
MKKIIEEIYYGNLNPEEHIVPTNPDYRPLNRKISELKNEAKKRLTKSDFEIVEQIFDLIGESNSMHTSTTFVQGFRLGALVMIDVFCGEGKGFKE